MTNRILRAAAAVLLFSVACGGDGTGPGPSVAAITTISAPTSAVSLNASAGVFAVKVTNSQGNPVSGVTVTFTATGSGSVSPTSANTDANGAAQTTVTASGTAGTLTVVASVSGGALHTDFAISVLAAAAPAPCQAFALGAVTTFQNVTSLCLNGASADQDFALIAYNGDTLATQSFSITPTGLGTPPAANVLAPTAALAYRGASLETSLVPDLAFHQRMREQARRLSPLVASARAWQAGVSATQSSTSGQLAPSAARHSTIPANPQVGDLATVNVDVNGDCTTKDFRAVRVMALGSKSIVMADTANPAGGFTTADYQNFAARFDTLVYPLDVGNFGAPTDIDGNGKVVILFTRAVNEATAANSSSYIAGFFADRDLFPKVGTSRLQACGTSNEAEMFYMLAPDPNGTINGNVRPTTLIAGFTTGTIAHEFQHLINAGRRLYVNPGADFPEVTWLNEGLSHEAEELLYYREAGRQPRQNLTDANIRLESSANYQLWKDQQSQNFQRYSSYLSNPSGSSPRGLNDDNDDALSTRGGIWSYLRYAADRLYTTDGNVWYRLVNSTGTGLASLRQAFGADQVSLLRDWTIANYLDDSGFNADPKYQQLSWNFRDIYTKTFTAGVFPLKVTGLTSGASVPVSVRRNSAGYFRLTVPANGQAVMNLTSNGTAPAVALQFVVVRTR